MQRAVHVLRRGGSDSRDRPAMDCGLSMGEGKGVMSSAEDGAVDAEGLDAAATAAAAALRGSDMFC